jgi:predicted membrane protein
VQHGLPFRQEEFVLRRPLALFVAAVGSIIVMRIVTVLFAKQLDEGTEASDEFRRVAVMNGIDFSSRAGGLRSGAITVALGGARVDLRGATLDPGGAKLVIDNRLGGVQVLVRSDWNVTVDEELRGGGEIDIDIIPADDLPEDAPKLHVRAMTSMAGTQIMAQGA